MRHNNNPVGFLFLGLSALIEYVFPPFPGDTVTLFGAFLVTRYQWSMPWVFFSVLLGSGIGAMLDFYLGRWMENRYEHRASLKHKSHHKIEKIIKAFKRHGEAYIALNRFLPAIRALFFVAAGMAGLRSSRVLFFALISAAAWNTLILGVGYAVGANWEKIQSFFRVYALLGWLVVGVITVFFLVRWLIQKKNNKSEREGVNTERP